MKETTTKNIRNGVDVDALNQVIEAVQADSSLAEFKFRAKNQWQGGSVNRTRIQDYYGAHQEHTTRDEPFELTADEPPVLLGSDTGANPVEYVLTGLAGCVTTSLAYHAAANGIDVGEVSSSLEGDLDLRGFLGLDPEVNPGFNEIRVRFNVKSDADESKLREFMGRSPVFDTVTRPVPVKIEITRS